MLAKKTINWTTPLKADKKLHSLKQAMQAAGWHGPAACCRAINTKGESMQPMMKKVSIIRFAVLACIALALSAAAVSRAQAQDATAPSSADLAKRIDDLEKELTALKSQMAAPPPAAAPAPAPAAAAVPA